MKKMLTVYAPYNNSKIDEMPYSDSNDMEKALSSAYELSRVKPELIKKYERVDILNRVIEIMSGKIEELTNIAAEEGGKPYADSRIEVDRAINGVKLAIEYMGNQLGMEIPMGHTRSSANRLAFTIREPIGVVASVSAFNHPLNLIVHQTIPAIAAGCPVIIKPALTTPRSCFNFMKILYEAGLPEEWCRAMVCEDDVSQQLVTDKRTAYFSFIGSARVGWMLRSKLAPGTRCALEHGGSAPVIFEKDADIDAALPLLMKGGFYHAGQVCVSVQRIFVHESVAGEVTDSLVKLAKNLKVGDPMHKDTEVGPLILNRELNRINEWVKEAEAGGGKVLCGGKALSESCYEPTVLFNPPADAKVSTEEIFGPVICIYPYSDREEAISSANRLPYSFQGSIFTRDINTALDTAKKLNAAAVMINDHTAFRVDWMPFGGRKVSGIGVGGIPYSMDDMTEEKLIVFKSDIL